MTKQLVLAKLVNDKLLKNIDFARLNANSKDELYYGGWHTYRQTWPENGDPGYNIRTYTTDESQNSRFVIIEINPQTKQFRIGLCYRNDLQTFISASDLHDWLEDHSVYVTKFYNCENLILLNSISFNNSRHSDYADVAILTIFTELIKRIDHASLKETIKDLTTLLNKYYLEDNYKLTTKELTNYANLVNNRSTKSAPKNPVAKLRSDFVDQLKHQTRLAKDPGISYLSELGIKSVLFTYYELSKVEPFNDYEQLNIYVALTTYRGLLSNLHAYSTDEDQFYGCYTEYLNDIYSQLQSSILDHSQKDGYLPDTLLVKDDDLVAELDSQNVKVNVQLSLSNDDLFTQKEDA